MAEREWGETGVVPRAPPRLGRRARKDITFLLEARNIDMSRADDFFAELAASIGRYDGWTALREKSKPGAVRANLNAAVNAGLALNNAMNALDGNSCQLLAEVLDEGDVSTLLRDVYRVYFLLVKARRLAEEYPRRGALPDRPRLYLAADVADAIRTHLGCRPTTTWNSLFLRVLELVLQDAMQGSEVKAVHHLAMLALRDVKGKDDSGMIHYGPPSPARSRR